MLYNWTIKQDIHLSTLHAYHSSLTNALPLNYEARHSAIYSPPRRQRKPHECSTTELWSKTFTFPLSSSVIQSKQILCHYNICSRHLFSFSLVLKSLLLPLRDSLKWGLTIAMDWKHPGNNELGWWPNDTPWKDWSQQLWCFVWEKRRARVINPWGVPHKSHKDLGFSLRIIPLCDQISKGGGGGGDQETWKHCDYWLRYNKTMGEWSEAWNSFCHRISLCHETISLWSLA